MTYAQALEQLQTTRSRLSHTIQDYLAAYRAMETTCDVLDTPSVERKQAFSAIDLEISTLATEETSVRQARYVLTNARNKSNMVAPFYKLPPEIMARIFCDAACHCTRYRIAERYQIANKIVKPILNPVSIGGVCREWRHIAFGHLSLWQHIDLVVGRENTQQGYLNPEIWLELSRGAPLHINIRQYRLVDEGDIEDGWFYDDISSTDDHRDHPAQMACRLRNFLLPLAPQMCSLNLSLTSGMYYLPDLLTDWWSTRGTSGQAKALMVRTDQGLPLLQMEGLDLPNFIHHRRRKADFFQSLESLVLRNSIPTGWQNWSLNNLVMLMLETGHNGWSVAQTELASVLASCPRLECVFFVNIRIRDLDGPVLQPILLRELRLLVTDTLSNDQTIESILAMVKPGPHALSMSIAIPHLSESPHVHPVIAALRSFVDQNNVEALFLRHFGQGPCFATQFGPLPRIKTLVLDGFYFSDIALIDRRVSPMRTRTSRWNNPNPMSPGFVLWPDLKNLYLETCILQNDHLHRLLSLHSIQALYIRKCYNGYALRPELQMRPHESEVYAQSLLELVPKAAHFKEGWTQWPVPSRLESW
ncbi:hypothetical protein FRC12_018116 [Ceratobasidium sp. 428]|nr:hypothetical protein FRC09_004405 [Ceratobasidium sp. 395]KAG8735349.1 hypothetical protein FRC12_018116 [Ceratobasidium sp. 428]